MTWIIIVVGAGLAACVLGWLGEVLWWGRAAAKPTKAEVETAPPRPAPQSMPQGPLYYIVLAARHQEHAEAIAAELQTCHQTLGWPKPVVIRVAVEPRTQPIAKTNVGGLA